MPTETTRVKMTRATRSKGLLDFLKFGESYTSLILGIFVVVISTVFILSFVRNKNITAKTITDQQTVATNTQNQIKLQQVKDVSNNGIKSQSVISSTYTVVKGDSLWTIAETKYLNGYKWVDIAKANNLSNPGVLYAGMKLTLPKIEQNLAQAVVKQTTDTTMQTVNTGKIVGNFYKIAKGDTLWSIAVRAYGDGYQWIKIARANNLTDPGLIHVGNSLSIPRG